MPKCRFGVIEPAKDTGDHTNLIKQCCRFRCQLLKLMKPVKGFFVFPLCRVYRPQVVQGIDMLRYSIKDVQKAFCGSGIIVQRLFSNTEMLQYICISCVPGL